MRTNLELNNIPIVFCRAALLLNLSFTINSFCDINTDIFLLITDYDIYMNDDLRLQMMS